MRAVGIAFNADPLSDSADWVWTDVTEFVDGETHHAVLSDGVLYIDGDRAT